MRLDLPSHNLIEFGQVKIRIVEIPVAPQRAHQRVGNALLEIRDSRLYRQQFPTFEAYCRDRWNLSRPRAYQLLEAAEAVNNVSTIVDIVPATESQARPLTRLEQEVQREVWQEVVEETPPEQITAKVVDALQKLSTG